ncbi:hypothetical protein BGZ63DRAFT_371483 [Mariannaea sp. PMI_226]|nr:hypothetical protein BGZ63DRAFT_371483 [Mariannaea sp. PMI_226]
MSPSPYSSRDMLNLIETRNLTAIPKDQQALLDSPESWAVDSKSARRRPNVPKHVLETATQAYVASISVAEEAQVQSQPHLPTQPILRNGISAAPRTSPSHAGVQLTHPQTGDAGNAPSSPPEELISWPSSPEQPQPPRVIPESSVVRETPKAPMGPPPFPALVSTYPSSDGPEDDLEMELPQPHEWQDVPVNREAAHFQAAVAATVASSIPSGNRTMDTPPCAQQTLPAPSLSAGTTTTQSPKLANPQHAHPLEQRRERRMKPIHFDDTTSKKNHHVKNRLAPTKTFSQVPSSGSTSPSSIIPATFDEPRTPSFVMQSVENMKDVDMLDLDGNSDSNGHRNDMDAVAEESQAQPPATDSNQDTKTRNNQPHLPNVMDGDFKPYSIYTMAYPEYEEDYHGTLQKFISSCVMLRFMQNNRMLRGCLYDDFIRAFPTYLTYVGKAGVHQEPLPAIEWFNILPDLPIFNRLVVSRENVEYILEQYPKQVVAANQMVDEFMKEDVQESEPVIDLGKVSEAESGENHSARMDLDRAEEKAANNLESNGTQQPSSSVPRLMSASRQRVLTQAPPPPSPQLSSTSFSSSIATPAVRMRPPRTSQYFAKLAASVKPDATPRRRTAEERAKLREHFLRRRTMDTRAMRSSSKPDRN